MKLLKFGISIVVLLSSSFAEANDEKTKELLQILEDGSATPKKIKRLVRQKASVNARIPILKEGISVTGEESSTTESVVHYATPLDTALFWSPPEIVKTLIELGADVNVQGNRIAPVLSASTPEKAQILVDAGANVNARIFSPFDGGNSTLLHEVLPEVAKVLINAGANVNAVDSDGKSPLHCVGLEKTLILINAGSDVNIQDKNGNTPLHCAQSPEIAKVLINAGADLNLKNSNGITPTTNVHVLNVLKRASTQQNICEYTSNPDQLTARQCGRQKVCISEVYCYNPMGVGKRISLGRTYQAICTALSNGKCPSATACVMDRSIIESPETNVVPEMQYQPTSTNTRGVR